MIDLLDIGIGVFVVLLILGAIGADPPDWEDA
jgi:hypothetical protein